MQAEFALGKIDVAYSHAVELHQQNPDNENGLNTVGYFLATTGRCAQAVPFLEKLIAVSEDEQAIQAAKTNLATCKKTLGIKD